MLFEVIGQYNMDVFFHTEYKECLPSAEELKSIRSAGYRFKINGKIVDKEKIVTLVEGLKKS